MTPHQRDRIARTLADLDWILDRLSDLKARHDWPAASGCAEAGLASARKSLTALLQDLEGDAP